MKLPDLPTYYYLDHFTEMLSFVRSIYGTVLSDEHYAFITRFESLSRDARCLLIRMINRRGTVFNRQLFKYAEIKDIEGAAQDLIACGHARSLKPDDYASFLSCLPKTVLIQGAKASGRNEVRTSWSKPKLVEFFIANIEFATSLQHCGGERFIALDDTRPIEFLLYLYFGKTETDLKNFALRDLSVLRTNKQTSFSARFSDADEARACFHYSRVLDRIEVPALSIGRAAIDEIINGPVCPTDYAADIASKAAWQVGLFLEKTGQLSLAEELFRTGSSAECHERLVRLLYKKGDKSGAEALVRQMIDDPASDDEFVFATDFYARKFGGRRTALCTDLLRAGRRITVDDTYRGNPEAGVAGAMRRDGSTVFFAEYPLAQSVRFAVLGRTLRVGATA
jgi:DNA polymerase III subunit epsilon